LRCALFKRGRNGAVLTQAGHDFRAEAEAIVQTWDRARQQLSLPAGYSKIFRFGGPVALQDRMSIAWVKWMKGHAPSVAISLEAGNSDFLTDAAIMYLPRQRPGLVIEVLRQENLVLVAHPEMRGSWQTNLVFVDWGHEFRTGYNQTFPDLPSPSLSVALGAVGLQYVLALRGAAYLPAGLVEDIVADGQLVEVAGSPVFRRPIYLVYPSTSRDPDLLAIALSGLRDVTLALDSATG